jgi:hypothetical protein
LFCCNLACACQHLAVAAIAAICCLLIFGFVLHRNIVLAPSCGCNLPSQVIAAITSWHVGCHNILAVLATS